MRTITTFVMAAALVFMPAVSARGDDAQEPIRWYTVDSQKNVTLHLYLFYSQRCSHCQDALRFLDGMQSRRPWLHITRYETSANPENLRYYGVMAQSIGRAAGQVPAFFFCKQLEIGYVSDQTSGQRLEAALVRCHAALEQQVKGQTRLWRPADLAMLILLTEPPGGSDDAFLDLKMPEPESKVDLPLWGNVEAADVSLPLVTIVIASCDAFNPCAFFVLLFLLSLLVHAHSRLRMAVVGGIFVVASGVVYFLFMAAWLNLFLLIGHIQWITLVAGAIAAVIAAINIKDYFWFKRGVSLSIPEAAKPGMFQRMTRLVGESRWGAMLAGTVFLAATTNLYELLCTSGFPMVYTRVLTLRDLPPAAYYGYLALYNLIYVAPLALIVAGFVWTLGARKLTEREGRILKLLSGVMMLLLGGFLAVAPERLSHASSALVMLALSVAITALVAALTREDAGPNVPANLGVGGGPAR